MIAWAMQSLYLQLPPVYVHGYKKSISEERLSSRESEKNEWRRELDEGDVQKAELVIGDSIKYRD